VKRLRDILIVVVLGGIVVWAAATFIGNVHTASVSMSPVVGQAETACIEDGVICHAGYDAFSSEADAQAYLDGPEHIAAVKKRQAQADQDKKDGELRARAEEFAKQGVGKVKAACAKDGTLNCALIDKDTAATFAEMILKDREALSTDQHKR
jgi:hypothetical protein